ncbi:MULTISPECIES: hypothetical protein [Kitasatospora]|uniref:Uncharacterized protein n=1 Tax=Kitasatospora setae (strain ATCC 33774 / DSM 43861 / JCM 3304 / KCC A-0304 / NBRC 14216 / KM-6054) TaxID=452652 RepID=E4N666_KITSK|nr:MULTISPECIES: hypothetical protein [Kitasatospora]BAJ26697.1 hypothetical protein KSE_08600 [Kitasatospora setae KM-6054]
MDLSLRRPVQQVSDECAEDSQRCYHRAVVGRIIDATARNIDDYAAGRTSGNTLVPKS